MKGQSLFCVLFNGDIMFVKRPGFDFKSKYVKYLFTFTTKKGPLK